LVKKSWGTNKHPSCNKTEDESAFSAFHLLCNCPSLISLRMRLFSIPILSVEEYEGASASALLRFALASGRFTMTPSFVLSYENFFFLYCLILSVCLFVSLWSFNFSSIAQIMENSNLWTTRSWILINTVTCLAFATMKSAMCSVTDSGLLCRMSGLVSIANEDNTVTYH
jgi:hypothetical protein